MRLRHSLSVRCFVRASGASSKPPATQATTGERAETWGPAVYDTEHERVVVNFGVSGIPSCYNRMKCRLDSRGGGGGGSGELPYICYIGMCRCEG